MPEPLCGTFIIGGQKLAWLERTPPQERGSLGSRTGARLVAAIAVTVSAGLSAPEPGLAASYLERRSETVPGLLRLVIAELLRTLK